MKQDLQILTLTAIGAIAVYILVKYVISQLTSRSESKIDDYLLKTAAPYLGIGVFAYGLLDFLAKRLPDLPDYFHPLSNIIIIGLGFSWFIHFSLLARPTLIERIRNKSSNRALGFAIPLLSLAVIWIFVLAFGLYIVAQFGGSDGLQLTLTIIGATSFLLAYIFQEPLANLFGGVALLLDSPFEYGDLIILEDGKTYRVDNTGSRVTQLYDIQDHTHAYVPNTALGGQRIINITLPNTELREDLTIGVAYGSDLEKVRDVLLSIVRQHPNVLSNLERKLPILEKIFSENIGLDEYQSRINNLELARLKIEHKIRESTELLKRHVRLTIEYAGNAERYGLSKKQRAALGTLIDDLIERLRCISKLITIWLPYEFCLDVIYSNQLAENPKKILQISDRFEFDIDKLTSCELDTHPIGFNNYGDMSFFKRGIFPSLSEFALKFDDAKKQPTISLSELDHISKQWDLEIVTMVSVDDMELQYKKWLIRIRHILRSLRLAKKRALQAGSDDYLVDQALEKASRAIRDNLKIRIAGQQYPVVEFADFADSAIMVRLEFFIDNIAGEHFKRRDRVRSEVFSSIEKEFKACGIEMPFPQIEVNILK